MYVHELYYMNASRNVYHAYTSRKAAENWAKWAEEHPREAELLVDIEKILDDDEE